MWLVLAIVIWGAPHSRADDLDVPGIDSTELRGDAMVWEDATFYAQPWESAPNIRFTSMSRRAEEVGRALAVRILDASLRAFVEIEVPGQAHCSWRKIVADPRVTGMRWYVARRDLAPVLTKPYTYQPGDGTRLKLSVGTPVAPTPAGGYMVAIKDDRVHLPIPHASVGFVFKPAPPVSEVPPPGKLARIDRNAAIRIGELSYSLRSNWFVAVPNKLTDPVPVEMRARCVEAGASVAATSLRPHTGPLPTITVAPPRTPPQPTGGFRIPAGAPLLSRDGRELAVAALSIAVPAPATDTVCFDSTWAFARDDVGYSPTARTMTLCASSALVER
jgi:hypothetical protein